MSNLLMFAPTSALHAISLAQYELGQALWQDDNLQPGVTAINAPAYELDGTSLTTVTPTAPVQGNRLWEVENFGRDPVPSLRPRRHTAYVNDATASTLTAYPSVPATRHDQDAAWKSNILALVGKAELGTYEFDLIIEAAGEIRLYLHRPTATWGSRDLEASSVDMDLAGTGAPTVTNTSPGGSSDATHRARTTDIGSTIVLDRLADNTARVRGLVTVLEPGVGLPIFLSISNAGPNNPAPEAKVGPVLFSRSERRPPLGLFPGYARALEITAGTQDWPASLPLTISAVGVCPSDPQIFWEHDEGLTPVRDPEVKTVLEFVGSDWTARLVIVFDDQSNLVPKLGIRLSQATFDDVEATTATQVWSDETEQVVALQVMASTVRAYVDGVNVAEVATPSNLGNATLYRVGTTVDGSDLVEPFVGRLRNVFVSEKPQKISNLQDRPTITLADEFENAAGDRVLVPWNNEEWRLTQLDGFILGGSAPSATVTLCFEDVDGDRKMLGSIDLDGTSPATVDVPGAKDMLSFGSRHRRLLAVVTNDLGGGSIALSLSGRMV